MSSIVVTRASVNTGSSAVLTKASVSVVQPTGSSVVITRGTVSVAQQQGAAVIVTRATVSVVQPVGSSLFVTRALVAVAPNLVASPGSSRANLRAGSVRPLAVQAANQGIFAYEWTQVSGPPVTIVDGDKPNASYTAPASVTPASVVLQLRVGDGRNWSQPAQVVDTIAAHPSWQLVGGTLTPVVARGYVKPIDPTPVTPVQAAGSAPLGTTNYAIPAGAMFVSPTGSDTAAGTLAAPYATIGKAVAMAGTDSTVVVRAGVYHESVSHSKVGLTIQAYPGEVVWWDGAVPVTGWTQSGSKWSAPWVTTTDRSSTYSSGVLDNPTPGWGFINPAYPYASWPDQVFLNGVYLKQVGALADVVPGTFFVEGTASGTNNLTWNSTRIHIGDNPAGKLVEASNLPVALTSVGQYAKVLGMGFRRYNPPQPSVAAVKLLREFSFIENCIIQDCTTGGLTFIRPDCTANQITVTDCGMTNIHANQADRLVLNAVESRRANRENFNYSPSAGGMKVTRLRTVTVSNSTFSDNNCSGIWFDESVYDVKVISCNVQNNKKHGVIDELGGTALFVDNLITGNGGIGAYTFNTDDVHIWNNTIVGNGEANVDVNHDSRSPMTATSTGRDPRQAFPDPTVTWWCDNVEIKNNVIGKMPASQPALRIRDSRTSGQRAAATFGPDIDGNFYNWVSASTPWRWAQANAGTQNIATFSAFRVNTAMEAHGVANVGIDQINADFTLQASALTAAASAARPLPADVAAAAGQATGVTHMGAWRSGAAPVTQTGIFGYIGDSLTYQDVNGTGTGATNILASMRAAGWSASSQVSGVPGRKIIGGPPNPTTIDQIAAWRAAGFDPQTWIFLLGNNSFAETDAQWTADYTAILDALVTTGKRYTVHLFDMTDQNGKVSIYYPRFLNVLKALAASRTDIDVVPHSLVELLHDGSDESTWWLTTDKVHMTAAGYAARNAAITRGIGSPR